MDQQSLIKEVLGGKAPPEVPGVGQYLSLQQALRVVDETIDYVGRNADAVTYKYLEGHRNRLATTLTMIPIAVKENASFLDVGCFGYVAFWARRHLGYARAEGIELHTAVDEPVSLRPVRVGQDEITYKVYNFDIARPEWPVEGTYDTITFLETLEHVNSDPMGVMLNVTARMHEASTLVMSVPNAVSYLTLRQFVSGMPPWTYWFFNPDLMHEPRHCFEYTPIILKALLRAAGLEATAFRTICAYSDRATLDDIFAIGEALSIDPSQFGETMIAQARKSTDVDLVRYPDCLYDGEHYYKSTFPLIEPIQREAISSFMRSHVAILSFMRARSDEVADLKAKLAAAEERADVLQSQLFSALFSCEGLISSMLVPKSGGFEWLGNRHEASSYIAREVWFERQRWGLPYKIGKKVRRILESWRGRKSGSSS